MSTSLPAFILNPMTNIVTQTIDLAIQIQQIPAPTFSEGQRAEFTRDLF
ncbi:hypothetical protein [Candidatus Villigracilis affinis]|nr:hypothetical protein [Anaerolineales bacterium]